MPERALVIFAAALGALGVGLMAAAAHVATGALDYAATIALAHAPAIIVIVIATRANLVDRSWGMVAAATLLTGAALFTGDITARTFLAHRLFPNAAPIGGFALIAGWLLVGVAAALARRR